jgi:hypothetical protein
MRITKLADRRQMPDGGRRMMDGGWWTVDGGWWVVEIRKLENFGFFFRKLRLDSDF